MRKRILDPVDQETRPSDSDWLKLEEIAEVEITSEDPAHPIEHALIPSHGSGWRAAAPGKQTIRLRFNSPQQIQHIHLRFNEPHAERTQEYTLRWSRDEGATFQEIVRQQWNFSPLGAPSETEDHHVELSGVTALELNITPEIGGSVAYASLEQLRIA
jgi:hypothetical protein